MGRKRRVFAVLGALTALSLLAAACGDNGGDGGDGGSGGGSFQGVPLTGAGATFPDPIYETWFTDFLQVESGAKINYQAIGSGGGIEQYTQGTVDFGASDAPMKEEEIAAATAAGRPPVEIPTLLGGVVVAYNVSGLETGLKLDGATTAGIFQGKITTWDDAAIAALNPDVTLPSTPIQVAHRSDESGTTNVFTSWLTAESPDWSSAVGAGKAVEWPTGVGGDGNDGVAAAVSQTDGSVGYLSYDFAVSANLGIADIKRADGTYITPSVEAISAAGGDFKFPISEDTNILNAQAEGAYPISSSTYLLIPSDLKVLGSQDKAQTLVDFLNWALTTGQGTVQSLNYAPLPQDIATQALDLVGQLTYNGAAMTPSSNVSG
jgi:phosphate transport system substrate-binding protein